MSQPSLLTPNSGLRVFGACLLSALLIMMPFVQLAAASGRSSAVARSEPENRQQAENRATDRASTSAAAENVFLNAPIPKPAPEPPMLLAPSITATKVDSWDDSATPDGKIEPGQVVTYTVTINNGGPDPATGVTFTDNVDTHTTLIAGSIQTQPLAIADTATAFGNVRISTANGAVNLLANDCDPDDTTGPCNDNLTASGPVTSTNNGNVVVNADGTFEYNPFPGFNGTDTFTYTIRDRGPDNIAGNSDDKTDTAVMTITVGPTLIWFINNSAAPGGDGRLTSPFNSIAAFNAGAADDPGDIIFIFFGTGANYTGGITLLNTQKIIGQGFLLQTETGAPPAGSNTLPSLGSAPTIDNAGANIITLAQNNTLRGFNTGNSGAAGTDISGTSFGTLTISTLSINGDGRALNLTTGTLAATVVNILASNTGANDGVTLNAVGGSLTVSTNTTITNPGGDGIDISNAPASTSYNFGTATVSKNAAGAGVILASNNAATTTSFTSLTITNSVGAGIITNAGGTVNVTTGSIATTGAGVAASLTNTVLGMIFTSVSSNGGANGLVISGGSGSFTSGTTNLQNNAGIGLLMASSAVVANFGNTTVNSSAGDAVDLSSNTGNITFADLDMTPDAGLRGLDAQNNTGTITVTSGDITTSGAATASAVFVDGPAGRTPINLTFTAVTTSGVGNTTTVGSVTLIDVSGTKFQVTGTTQVNTRAGTGVFVDNATTTTIQLGTTNIPNANNAGGHGIHVEDSSSAVTISTATISNANVVTGQTDPGSDFVPDTDGDGDAIFLKNNTGSFTLNGGTLSDCGNDCIDTRDSQNFVISGVTIDSPGIDMSGASGSGTGGHGIQAINLKGTNSITNSTITDWETNARDGLRYINHTSTASTLTVHGTTFSASAAGSNAIFVSGRDNANMTLNVGGAGGGQACTFSEIFGAAITHNAGDNTDSTALVNLNVINSSFTNVTTKGQNSVSARNLARGRAIVVISGNTFDGVGRTVADTSGVIDVGADATSVPATGNFFHFTITNNVIKNIGDNINNSCGALECHGKRGIDVFIDDNSTIGNDSDPTVDADDDVVIDGNVITNVQRMGIIFDIGSVYNGSNVAARITNNRVGIRADNTIDRVGVGDALATGGENAIRVENRNTNAKNLNILIQNNLFYNGNGAAGSALNNSGMLIRGQGTATMSGTVTNNTFNVNTANNSNGINAQTTGPAGSNSTFCFDASGNAITAPGTGIALSEVLGTLNVEQASLAALSAANGGATTATVTGSPSFGVACATPPAAFNILRPEPREYVASVNRSEEKGSAAPAISSTQTSRPSLSTIADNAVTNFTREAGSLLPPALASATAATEFKSGATTHDAASVRHLASDVSVESSAARAHHARTEKAEAIRTESDSRAHHANTARTIAVPVGAGGTVTVNIGTLPANDSVTITFQVTMDNPPNASPAQISNQGTVSGTNFSNVLTDDPSVGGASDPTVTEVNLFDTTTSLGSNLNPSNFGDLVTFTATVNETPVQAGADPAGTVDFIDTSNGNAVICNDVALTAGSAQCQTSTLTAGTHNIRADYSGDGNFDPSQSNIVAQVVNACTPNPIVTSTDDSGAGTLREAIANVCAGTTITFNLLGAGPHTITLTTGELAVAKNVTINNNSGESITVTNATGRAFNINAGKTVSILGLTITGNSTADGGAVLNDGSLTVINSTLTGSTSAIDGGAISTTATGTALTLINTTISGNTAAGSGGGVIVLGGTFTSINSTFTNNIADSDNNAAGTGGAIRAHAGTTTLKNTIVAGNLNEDGVTDAADDISGTVDAASSFNLIGDTATAGGLTNGVNNNQVGVAAGLGALASNGGTTQTHALLSTSLAIETGSNANLPVDTFDLDGDADTAETLPVDQRGLGYPRNADSADSNTTQTVDIGAFELHPSIEDIPNDSTNEDTAKNVLFNLGDDTGSLIATVAATSSNTTLVPNANLIFSGSGGSRNLQITPAAGQSGTTTITVTVTATNGRTATDTFDLVVTGLNDPPSGADNTVLTNEDTAYTFTAADFGFTDPNDVPPNTLVAVKITTLPGVGTLTNNNVPVNAGDFIPVADINGGLLKFTPVANANGTPYTSFTFQVQDNGGGTDLDPTPNTMTINVTAVNDPPSFTIAGNPPAVIQDAGPQTVNSFATNISAGPNETQTLTFNLSPTGSTGTLTFSTAPAINETTGTLTYTATNGTNGTATFDVTLSDNGSNTPPNSNTSGAQSFTITVNSPNATPVVTATAGNLAYTENDPATFIDSGLTVTDSDNTDLTGATVSITAGFVSAQDTLAFANQLGITGNYNSGTGVLTLTGTTTVANYQTALRTVTYQNSSDNPTASRTITFSASDGITSGTATRSIAITAVNDAPVNTVPGPQSTTEDTAKVFSSGNGNQISVADVDAGSNPVKITLTATNGTVTLSGTAGLTFTPPADGTDDATMVFTGTLTAVNTALNGMSFNPTSDFTGAASLQIVSDDQGNTGTGGPLTDTDSVNITVNAANDLPVVTTTAGNLSYTENDAPTAIDPTLTVTDVDDANLEGATVAITSGFVAAQDTLAFTNQNGITGNYNSGTGVLTLTGSSSVANYQTALRSVTYANSSDDPTASRTVTFIVDDGSSTSTPATRGITITAVNDPPVNTVPGSQGTNQDTPLVFSGGNQISVADADAGSNSIQVTLTATNGTLTLSGTSGLSFGFSDANGTGAGDGTADATMTFRGTIADINTALNGMTFTPTLGFSGAASLTITSNDLGNTGSGGPLSDTDVVNIQVGTNLSINDAKVAEPTSGSVNMIFTVTLSAPAPAGGASVNFTTQNEAPAINHAVAGTCGSGGDYVATSGAVNFATGEQFKTINVSVCADTAAESNETFLVLLSSPVNATISDDTATGTILISDQPGTVLISELRTSGPGGAGDDFVEIYNNTNSPHVVNGTGGGYGLFKMGTTCGDTPILIGVIPNGTTIPARGHYLFTGSAYSLANYGGTGAGAGDQIMSADIESDRNVAIFSTANVASISSANRFDGVGFGGNTGGNCDLFREGTTLVPLNGSVVEYSYFRKQCDWIQGLGCTVPGIPKDTNNNSADFWLADTNGTVTPAGQRLGAPGPENLSSPIRRDNSGISVLLLDGSVAGSASVNRARDNSAPEGTFGTMTVRRRIANNTGGNVTRLRYRVVDISTLNATGTTADLRALTGVNEVGVGPVNDSVTCTASGAGSPPCTVTVLGTTLETPPAQLIGGGYNATLSSGTITLGTPLVNGASINVNFRLGVEKPGTFRFFIIVEALP